MEQSDRRRLCEFDRARSKNFGDGKKVYDTYHTFVKQRGREILNNYPITPPQFIALQWLRELGDLRLVNSPKKCIWLSAQQRT